MSQDTQTIHPIDRAAAVVGSQARLAVVLGVTRAAVHQWKSGDRQVPAEHCPAIEQATGGVVRCEDLRPDVAWAVLREQVAPVTPPPPAPPIEAVASTTAQA